MALDNLNRLIANMKPAIEDELEYFAGEWEEWARAHRTWQDDSGSAATALTSWVIGAGDKDKNINLEPWRASRKPGYRSPRHKNFHWNFYPAEVNIDEVVGQDDDAIVVCLSHRVQYGDALEADAGGHLLEEALRSHVDDFVRRVESAIAGI